MHIHRCAPCISASHCSAFATPATFRGFIKFQFLPPFVNICNRQEISRHLCIRKAVIRACASDAADSEGSWPDLDGFRVGVVGANREVIPKDIVQVAQAAADAARQVIRRWYRCSELTVDYKQDESPVTIADREAERAMRNVILNGFPGHVIIGEEESGASIESAAKAEYAWVLDPIDGTKAFMTGKPTFGTLIAVLREGIPVFGIIDQAITSERWMGGYGWPTTLNDKSVSVKKYTEVDSDEAAVALLSSAIVHSTHPSMFRGTDAVAIRKLIAKVKQVLYGSDCYAYALLASGYTDLVVEADLKVWDYAALAPIIQAAGGIITDWNGRALDIFSDGRVVASASYLHHQMTLQSLGMPDPFHEILPKENEDESSVLPADPGVGCVESMTGYGESEATNGVDRSVVVQVRSVNSRFCEVQFRGPRSLNQYESELIALVKRTLNRGRIVCTVAVTNTVDQDFPDLDENETFSERKSFDKKQQLNSAPRPKSNGTKDIIGVDVDERAAQATRKILDRLATAAGIDMKPTIADILSFSEVLVRRESGNGLEEILPLVRQTLIDALEKLVVSRRREGAILEEDVISRCSEISRILDEIDCRAPIRVEQEMQRLHKRVRRLADSLHDSDFSRSRLEQEIAIVADRIDITEEVVRLRAHVQLFELTFADVVEPIGQRLQFLLQEMHREASTISSKANDAPIAQLSVLIKQEIEKIREQVQNIC